MHKRIIALSVLFILLISAFGSLVTGDVPVGMKVGDWIEYTVSTTGTPPEVHNVQWARMDIISIQGSEIKVNSTTEDENGNFSSIIMNLDLERGEVGAWFIIPANLNVGDQFYDINLARNVTIEGQEQKAYAGTVRTVINASIPERIKEWDKATGVFLKSIDTLPGYTINATAIKTNMWTSQISMGDQTLLYLAIAVVLVVVVLVVIILLIPRRRR